MQATAGIHSIINAGQTARFGDLAVVCFHCGTPGGTRSTGHDTANTLDEKWFCCAGCRTVFELLSEHGLNRFYALTERNGQPVGVAAGADRYTFLDSPEVRARFVHYSDDTSTRVTFRVPALHCVACVWLLENLFRLKPGIGPSTVAFVRKEVTVGFDPRVIRLAEVATLLESLGYPPDLNLADLERPSNPISRRLWLQVAVAGFAFGNTMLFSLPAYFGLGSRLDTFSGPEFKAMFGWLSLALSIPVVVFSAADYWRSCLFSLRQRRMSIEVPIAAGIAALWLQSAWEVGFGRGAGYFDSLAGLLFFLLCGRIFQQKTFDRISFDRDYRSFFPLSVLRMTAYGEERVAIDRLGIGERIERVPRWRRCSAGPGPVARADQCHR